MRVTKLSRAATLQNWARSRFLLRAILEGKARWEPFAGVPDRGEVCVGGMRYTTELDGGGVPIVYGVMCQALEQALGCYPEPRP